MKIAISGKGGSGKTTIAGTMARVMGRMGLKVLAIDADDNPNLAITLGLPADMIDIVDPIPTRILAREGESLKLLLPPETIVDKYSIYGPDNVRLLIMTKIEKAGVGCACGSHVTVRELVGHLKTQKGEVIVMDMEPGLEIMGRATPMYTDVLITVVEPYYKSVQTAIKLFSLSKDLGIKNSYAVLNKVRSNEEVEMFSKILKSNNIKILGIVPYDNDVIEADKRGKALIDYSPNSVAVEAIKEITEKLLKEVER